MHSLTHSPPLGRSIRPRAGCPKLTAILGQAGQEFACFSCDGVDARGPDLDAAVERAAGFLKVDRVVVGVAEERALVEVVNQGQVPRVGRRDFLSASSNESQPSASWVTQLATRADQSSARPGSRQERRAARLGWGSRCQSRFSSTPRTAGSRSRAPAQRLGLLQGRPGWQDRGWRGAGSEFRTRCGAGWRPG